MNPLFQLSTRKYEDEIDIVRKAMVELEGICGVKNGYQIGEPHKGWLDFL
jgi:hypothetical protein